MAPCYPYAREGPASVRGGNRRVRKGARARSTGLIVRDLRGEVVVYDTLTHRAHCLNATAAFVFRHADGHRSDTDIARLLGPGADDGLVASALEQLAGAGLLEPSSTPADSCPSRREVLRQVGVGAAVLAPVVLSLVVPTPAEASATCIPATACTPANIGQPCYNSNHDAECPTKTCQGAGTCV
jgi:hypothetical protein